MTRLSGRKTAMAVVVAAVALSGCAANRAARPPSETPAAAAAVSTATPEAVVTDFYTLHAEGREADAFALLSKAHDPVETTSAYAQQTRWRRDLRLMKVGRSEPTSIDGRPDFYRTLFDVRQLTVEFFQEHDAPARERGQQLEFVNVARETSNGPWRVIEIGTGP